MANSPTEADQGGEQIDFRERHETQLWMQALDVDEKTLRKAVSEAGKSVDNVRVYLAQRMKEAARIEREKQRAKPAARSKATAKKRSR